MADKKEPRMVCWLCAKYFAKPCADKCPDCDMAMFEEVPRGVKNAATYLTDKARADR